MAKTPEEMVTNAKEVLDFFEILDDAEFMLLAREVMPPDLKSDLEIIRGVMQKIVDGVDLEELDWKATMLRLELIARGMYRVYGMKMPGMEYDDEV